MVGVRCFSLIATAIPESSDRLADGTRPRERLTAALPGTSHEPESWSPAGDDLLFSVTKAARVSLWRLSMPDRKAEHQCRPIPVDVDDDESDRYPWLLGLVTSSAWSRSHSSA